jgi:UDPglucose 6-dehydrogenase
VLAAVATAGLLFNHPAASDVPPNSRSLPALQLSVVDLNAERSAAWSDPDLSKLPAYEPGLAALVDRARGRNLHFSTEVDAAIAAADMVILSVNTPTKAKGVGARQPSGLCWIEAALH